jgi:ATP-binding cassette subfamily B multidrug efflux pump
MRIVTKMDMTLTFLNGLMILGVGGLALWLWMQGTASVGVVAAAMALVLRLNSMTYWIMWASTNLLQNLGDGGRRDGDDRPAVGLVDAGGAKPCTS